MTKKGGSQHRWTTEEIETVRRDFTGTKASLKRISEDTGIPQNAVAGMVQKLGINRLSHDPPWSPRQDAILRRMIHQGRPANAIAKATGHSINAVAHRTRLMQAQELNRDAPLSTDDAAAILGTDQSHIRRIIDEGHLPATEQQGITLISQDALRDYIITHPDELASRNLNLPVMVAIITGDTPGPRPSE